MAVYASLNRDSYLIDDGNDSKVIIRNLAGIPGGVTLDMTDWSEDVLKAGHIIKYDPSTKVYAPLGVSDDAYASLESGEEYAGVLVV